MANLRPFDFLEAVWNDPETFLRARHVVRAALGTQVLDLAADAGRVTSLQLGAHWPGLVDFPYRGYPGHPEALAWATGQASDLFRTMGPGLILHHLARLGADATPQTVTRVEQVLDDLAGGARANLGIDAMRSLIGHRWLTADDIVLALGRGTQMVRREALDMAGGTWTPDRLEDALYQVRGISGFFATLVQRSGYEWGGRTEVRSLAALILDGIAASSLRLSLPMADGRLGPDIAHYIMRAGRLMFRIFQVKALADFGQMAAERAYSETLRQLLSDLGRLGAQGWQAAARNADAGDASAAFDGTYTFLFDFDHFVRRCPDPVGYLENFVARHEGDLDLVIDTSDAATMLSDLSTEMARALDQMAEQLTGMLDLWRGTGPLGDANRGFLLDGLNAMLREGGRIGPDAALDVAEITSARLLALGVLTADEAADLTAATADDLLRIAAARSAGLTPQMLADMPPVRVQMKLVMKGNPGFLMGLD